MSLLTSLLRGTSVKTLQYEIERLYAMLLKWLTLLNKEQFTEEFLET